MHMSFWSGTDLGPFLFPGYVVTNIGSLIGACLSIMAVAIVYEAMKTLQIKLHQMTKASLSSDNFQSIENSSLIANIVPKLPRFSSSSRCLGISHWLLEVLHYSAHTTLGYILMLAAMSYNIYIFLALIIGSIIGYWIFSPALLNLNMSELHQRYKTIPPCSTECTETVTTPETRQSGSEELVSSKSNTEVNAVIHTDEPHYDS